MGEKDELVKTTHWTKTNHDFMCVPMAEVRLVCRYK